MISDHDLLIMRIKAHRSAPDVYDPPTFDQMADRIAELEAKLAKAEKYAEDAKACLNSWFDTTPLAFMSVKKLAREQIDPKVVEAAAGYLRVSRSGGMETHESDLVLAVIQDMAFRGVFSSIYTQFTLAELKGDKE